MFWHAYGSVAPENGHTDANGIVGVPLFAVVGPVASPPAPTYSPESAYGPTTAAGLGVLAYLGTFDHRPTEDEVELLRDFPRPGIVRDSLTL